MNLWELIYPLNGQCMVFCPTKSLCEHLANVFAQQGTLLSDEKKNELLSMYNVAVMEYQVAATLQSGGQDTK